jgi:hypothetical protein
MEQCTEQNKDYELRYDMLVLLEQLIGLEAAMHTFAFYAEKALRKVLIQCCVWKAGKHNANIRRMALTSIQQLLDRALIDKETFFKHLKDLVPVLKSCLEDEWAADLRLAGVRLLNSMMGHMAPFLTGTYTELR